MSLRIILFYTRVRKPGALKTQIFFSRSCHNCFSCLLKHLVGKGRVYPTNSPAPTLSTAQAFVFRIRDGRLSSELHYVRLPTFGYLLHKNKKFQIKFAM